ncbi:MAG: tyrosine-type recombinase/integrase [Desulfurococcales archaeon]|nr:tyrosine-type recombinase/integrase [Desulfurococcales archaeon]MCE4604984.1 tyrosine-type recombinase/integrase [Desulfurococcales archaeon]
MGPDTPLREIDEDHYLSWISRLRKEGVHRRRSQKRESLQNTLHYYTLFVKRFLTWLGIGGEDLPVVPRKRHIIPDTLSWEEVKRLIEAARDIYDALIVSVLAETGMRVSELLSIRIRDIDLDKGEVRIRGKYGKERIVFLGPASRALIKAYIDSSDPSPREKLVDMSYQAVHKRLKRLAIRAGIEPSRVRPHVLRHTFATEAIRRGMSLPALQKLLGHSDIKITEVYLHMNMEDVRREYASIFYSGPGARAYLEEHP